MSKLETAVSSLVELFKEYSGKEGKKGQLSSAELKEMLEKELSTPELKEKFNPEEVDTLLKDLDKGKDNLINFREFCRFVTLLARAYYKMEKEAKK
ncbi:S100 calcium binding protein W [Anguilla anguilla]|uniref:S100 calcium binding protein W n=1 Tax=Anguilla anguilla TaxID=7936 RepID=UPI0015B1D461|nr:S100 calcium binding protein W [Anguilla anguilla]